MSVLTDLKNRGVENIFIACINGLIGFPDACGQSSTLVCRDLKQIYSAVNEEEALDDFCKKWNSKYPMIQCSW